MEGTVEKLVIIGSGPAGLTSAIYAARGNLKPVVITGPDPGGQPMLTSQVDDYPGFPEGAQGPELMAKFRAQAEEFGTRFLENKVTSVDFKKTPFEINFEGETIMAEVVIVASGASPKFLDIPSEKKFIGRGVSVCAVCDGPFFKGKKVIVVGGGDAAMREAEHLSKYAALVTVVHRRDTLRAQEALQEVVKAKDNVKFMFNSAVEEIVGEEKVAGVKIKNTQNGEVSELEVDGVFLAIGHQPNTEFLQGQVDLDKGGFIVIHEETRTSVPGVFVAGDVADRRYRQMVVASGAGCKAALDAEEYLDEMNIK